MSTKERLKEFIKSQGLSVKAFEESINVSNVYVNAISKGLGREKLDKVSEVYPELDIKWLLTGEKSKPKKLDLENRVELLENTVEMLKNQLKYQQDSILFLQNIFVNKNEKTKSS